MATLVTGITGFVGSHLGRQLLRDGQRVCAIVRPGASTWRIDDYLDRIELIEADLADADGYAPRLRALAPERAFHVAWYAKHGRFWTAPENLDCLNMTLSLTRALADAGCARLVCVGSCAEYSWCAQPLREAETPCEPSSLYGAAKNSTRQLVMALAGQLGLSVAWARLFFPYGPAETPTRLIPQVTLALLRGERARCSHGRQLRDFLHVEDCAAGLAAIAQSDLRGPVNLASGVPSSIASVVESLARLCGRERDALELGAIAPAQDDPPCIVADTHRLASIGWKPSRSLEQGLADTVSWWKTR